MTPQESYIKACVDLMGLPYLWDGKGLHTPWGWNGVAGGCEPYNGRDCSGFAMERLNFVGGPDYRLTHNTGRIWTDFQHVDAGAVQPGDLALWGRPDGTPHHVMVRLGVGGLLIGAAGGDQTTVTQQEALRRGARVMTWQSPNSMPGFLGFVRIPWLATAQAAS